MHIKSRNDSPGFSNEVGAEAHRFVISPPWNLRKFYYEYEQVRASSNSGSVTIPYSEDRPKEIIPEGHKSENTKRSHIINLMGRALAMGLSRSTFQTM